MNFLQLAKTRGSIRQYQDKKVEPEKLLKILEAGRVAPTACNNQPQRVLVVQTPEGLERLQKGYRNIYGAQLALIICADHEQTWKRGYDNKDSADIDASIVTDHMILMATEQGLGSVWLCAFDPAAIREAFRIPAHIEPINILLVGYAASELKSPDRHETDRKSLLETVVYETF